MKEIFAGIERFSLSGVIGGNPADTLPPHPPEVPASEDGIEISNYVFPKKMECPVCGGHFSSYVTKEKKTRLMTVELDLRPVHTPIDPNYYDVVICPICGYANTRELFPNIIKRRRELVQEKISPYYRHYEYPVKLSADMAIERYKLVLLNYMVQQPKDGERAYICMKIMWLYRSKGDQVNERLFAKLALKGYKEAITKENPPIMGMNADTLNYIIGAIAANLGDRTTTLQFMSAVITSASASTGLKDKARELKDTLESQGE